MAYPAKPTSAQAFKISGDALATGISFFAPLVESSGLPADFWVPVGATQTTGVDTSGTTTPAISSDSEVQFCIAPATTDKALQYPGAGILKQTTGNSTATIAGIFQGPASGSASFIANGASGNLAIVSQNGFFNFKEFGNYLFSSGASPPNPFAATAGHWCAVAFGVQLNAGASGGTAYGFYWDFDATTPALVTATQAYADTSIGGDLSSPAAYLNPRISATFKPAGKIAGGLITSALWTSTDFLNFVNDPSRLVRVKMSSSVSALTPSQTGVSVPITYNAAIATAGTPGTPTVTSSSTGTGYSQTAQTVPDTTHVTLTVNTGTTGTATFSESVRGSSLAIPVSSTSPATGIGLTGPTTGTSGTASTNFTASLTGGTTTTGNVTVTPACSGLAGTFSPTSVILNTATQSATFTFTASATGTGTISVTNNGSLTNPSTISYTSSAGTFVVGSLSCVPGTRAAFSLQGSAPTGASGSVTYQNYSSPDPTLALGSWTAETSGQNFTKTAAWRSTLFFTQVQTDSLARTGQTNVIWGSVGPPRKIGIALGGDSITYSMGQPTVAGEPPNPDSWLPAFLGGSYSSAILPNVYAAISYSNNGISGSTSAQWVPGQSNYTSLVSSVTTLLTTCDEVYAHFMLGANDCASLTPAQYATNLSSICSDLVANHGVKGVFLSYPIPSRININGGHTPAQDYVLYQFWAQIDTLVRSGVALRGDRNAPLLFACQQALYNDGVHPLHPYGSLTLLKCWCEAMGSYLAQVGFAADVTSGGVRRLGFNGGF